MSNLLLWNPTYSRAKAGRPARTYIQQLCADTGCSPEDLMMMMMMMIIIISCRVTSTDIPDPFSSLNPIIHRFWQVLRATSRISTELLYVGSNWSPCFCSTTCGGPLEYITYDLVPTSPVVSCIPGSTNFDSFRDGCSVAV